MSLEQVLFWILALLTTASAAIVVSARSPINSAMALVATFFFLAGIYVLLWAHTIAVLQILVYAGAIMVLFLFVIMLLSLTDSGVGGARVTLSRLLGAAGTVALLVLIVLGISQAKLATVAFAPGQEMTFGTLRHLGEVMYTAWLFPFEAVSLLLLVSIVGAVVVAKSRI